jgi:hypothetical protein
MAGLTSWLVSMEDFLESMVLPFLATMVVVGTVILVRLDTIARRKELEASEAEKRRQEPPGRPRRH